MAAFPGRLPAFRLPRLAVAGSARVRAASRSRTATPESAIGAPMRASNSSRCSSSCAATSAPTVPAPSTAMRMGALVGVMLRSRRG